MNNETIKTALSKAIENATDTSLQASAQRASANCIAGKDQAQNMAFPFVRSTY